MSERNRPIIGIVVPCFNEQDVITETTTVLDQKLSLLVEQNAVNSNSFILFVDDGSTDATWAKITNLSINARINGLKLAANVGHQRALLAGLHYSKELTDAIITIDADLQDDVDSIEAMIKEYQEGADIVFGVRSDRSSDKWIKRNSALLFYKTLEMMGAKTIENHADFRLMSKRAVEALSKYSERNLYLRGICASMGFQSAFVYYRRKPRHSGETKYPLRKMISLAIDGITSFSTTPLRIISLIGFLVFFGTIGASGWVVYAKLIKGSTVPGWSSTVLPMFFLGGIQLLSLGVIGEYLSKIYIETKARPLYTIDKETKQREDS